MTNQRKKGRPRSENPMVHTAIVLPSGLLGRLRKDAERSGRGLSAEIRQRLQFTDGLDPETRDLIEDIKSLADSLARDLLVPWHKTEFALDAFKAGITKFLGRYKVAGNAADTPFTGYADDAPSDVIGQTHARLILARRGDDAVSSGTNAQQLAGAAPEPNDELETD